MNQTIEITTHVTKAKVVIRSFMTGKQKNAINAPLYSEDISVDEKGESKTKFKMANLKAYEQEMVRQLVVSVNGSTENVYDAVYDLDHRDTDQVIEALTKVYKGEDFLVEGSES